MFPFLVALTFYMALAPVQPALSVQDYLPKPERAFLPMAADRWPDRAPHKTDEGRLGIELSSRGAAVIDLETGASLYDVNAEQAMPIASITKLMTALVVLDSEPDWSAPVTVMRDDRRAGNIPYLIPGEKIRTGDLFSISLIASANTATVALARSTGLDPDEFLRRMNDKALEIGMRSANFTDPTGLDEGNIASPHDVAVLVRHALGRAEIRDAVKRPVYEFRALTGLDHLVRTTNDLLWSPLSRDPYTLLGGKTGFIDEAGYCFGAGVENEDGDGVVAVVLGAPTREARFQEVKNLIYWTFDAYDWPSVMK